MDGKGGEFILEKFKEWMTKYNFLLPIVLLTACLVTMSIFIGKGTASVISIAMTVYFLVSMYRDTSHDGY